MKSELYVLKNDFNKIVFIGTKSRVYDFLIAGKNSILSNYYMYDFCGAYIKSFITK